MNDETAVRLVRDGDAKAFEHIVRRYQRPIYNLMLRSAGSAQAAEDLTQEAFCRAFKGLGSFDPERRLFPWLYSVGLNLARDFLRRKKAEPFFADQEDAGVPLETVSEQELALIRKADARAVGRALAALVLEQREALVLRFKEELSMREIADALGISPSGAKMRISRGLNRIRQILSEDGHGPGA